MTREQETAKARALLNFQRQFRDGLATLTDDASPEKSAMLAAADSLIARTRAHLERLGQPVGPEAPMVTAPESLQ